MRSMELKEGMIFQCYNEGYRKITGIEYDDGETYVDYDYHTNLEALKKGEAEDSDDLDLSEFRNLIARGDFQLVDVPINWKSRLRKKK